MSCEGGINCTTARKDRSDSKADDSSLYVPADVVTEILSWLPVESVQRLESVCRLWSSIVEDDGEFIHKHRKRATKKICVVEEGNGHLLKNACQGLVLEMASSKSNFRIRNPSTKRVLHLPDIPSLENSLGTRLCYVASTRTFKVICACPPRRKSSNGNWGFNILTIDVDDEWRTLSFPFTCNHLTRSPYCLANAIEELYVLLILPETESEDLKHEMVILEVKSEKVWRINIPQQQWSKPVRLMNWAGKPSICQRSGNDDELLHVWVVEDFKRQKWAQEKIVIDLTSIKDQCRVYKAYEFRHNKLRMHYEHVKYLKFDVESKVVTCIHSPRKKLRFRPSLVGFNGIKSLCLL